MHVSGFYFSFANYALRNSSSANRALQALKMGTEIANRWVLPFRRSAFILALVEINR
jgi:hypothetical protein